MFVGWSGGASYLGNHAQAWTDATAIVIHGGGMAPADDSCVKNGPPVYFLVGNRNPLHSLAKSLRAYYSGCNHEVKWDLVEGANHAREKAALTTKKALAILDWATAPR